MKYDNTIEHNGKLIKLPLPPYAFSYNYECLAKVGKQVFPAMKEIDAVMEMMEILGAVKNAMTVTPIDENYFRQSAPYRLENNCIIKGIEPRDEIKAGQWFKDKEFGDKFCEVTAVGKTKVRLIGEFPLLNTAMVMNAISVTHETTREELLELYEPCEKPQHIINMEKDREAAEKKQKLNAKGVRAKR